jgi:RNA polymerase sigma-70 factor (ECF subfamily)
MLAQADSPSARPMAEPAIAPQSWAPRSLAVFLDRFGHHLIRELYLQVASDLRAKCDSNDLVQEALLEAHRHFDHFHGDTEQEFLAWLRCLLRHQYEKAARAFVGTHKRRLGREVSLSDWHDGEDCDNELQANTPDPPSAAMCAEAIADGCVALARLRIEDHEILCLRIGAGMTFAEASSVLAITEDAARKRYARALERFRRALKSRSE